MQETYYDFTSDYDSKIVQFIQQFRRFNFLMQSADRRNAIEAPWFFQMNGVTYKTT